jgi:archaemetzincin
MRTLAFFFVGCLATAVQAEPLRPPSEINACLVPLGDYEDKLLPIAARGISFLFGFTVTTLDPLPLPKAAYYEPRKRYRAEKLLEFLNAEVLPGSGCTLLIGFTKRDISTTKEPYEDWGVLGLGEISGTASVVSTFRAGRGVSFRVKAQRTVKVVNHEIGHVLGLPHLNDEGCLMHDAEGTVKTIDKEHGLLCKDPRDFVRDSLGLDVPDPASFDWSFVLDNKTR